jgi:hypothetical protein
VVRISPFLIGPFVSPPRTTSDLFYAYARAYLIFILLFACWSALRAITVSEQRARLTNTDKKKQLALPRAVRLRNYFGLLLASVGFLASLQPFKAAFETENFYIALALVCAAAIADALELRKQYLGSCVLRALYYSGIGYLSFQPGLPTTLWQPALLSMGLGLMVAAQEMPKFFSAVANALRERKVEKRKDSLEGRRFSRLTKLFTLLYLCGPLCVAQLTYAHQLPGIFLLVFVSFAFSMKLVNELQRAVQTAELPGTFSREATTISLLFLVILGILSSLY